MMPYSMFAWLVIGGFLIIFLTILMSIEDMYQITKMESYHFGPKKREERI